MVSQSTIAQDLSVSTLKMGPYSLKMKVEDAEKIAERKLIVPSKENEYSSETVLFLNGERIKITTTQDYYNPGNEKGFAIAMLSTTSKKFKTKSNIGVGSTKDELIRTYKDYLSYSVYPEWDESGHPSKTISYFNLEDMEAGSTLVFKLVNNVVVEITISYYEGGC